MMQSLFKGYNNKPEVPTTGTAKPIDKKAMKMQLLDILGEVKTRVQDKLGIVKLPMPQFILIGSQSVGKSRLVESFAGEQFNFTSGTLGSRRPTVLEFRNVPTATESKWYTQEGGNDKGQWICRPMTKVMEIVGKAHQDLGFSVSSEPVYVRLESSTCVDMRIVDLPGFRSFSSGNPESDAMAQKIREMNTGFMADQQNHILCVEEAGDAANLSSLRIVQEYDPNYKRTVLIRNKLDKYYGDLTPGNVNKWLDGFGDLPKNLLKYAITLPHWADGSPPPKKLSDLRDDMNKQDIEQLKSLGTSSKLLETVGFNNFRDYMEVRIEKMYVEAIGPVIANLRELENQMVTRKEHISEELASCNPDSVLNTVITCGMSFANCLTHVMEGYIRSDVNRLTLKDELQEFHKYHEQVGDTDQFAALPSDDFGCLADYLDYLENHIRVPAHNQPLNGGAQFQRLMFEIETFLRFSEIGIETRKRDVLQSFGISMGSVTWREVIVKLLNHDAHLPLQARVKYVGERIKWFFMQQKEPILHFMKTIKGSPDEKLYSVLYTKHAHLIDGNPTIRKLVFDVYDKVVQRQLVSFIELFKSTLHATFANPWVFLKKTSASLNEKEMDEGGCLPSFEDTKDRIPKEIKDRTGIERAVTKWLYDIPSDPHKFDEACDQVQLLVLKVYSHIRSQICDQVELFADSFFKLPLMRRMEEDMHKIELSKVDKEGYEMRRKTLTDEDTANTHGLKEVNDCLEKLTKFVIQANSMYPIQK